MVGREANSKETGRNACRRSVDGSGLLKTGQHGGSGGTSSAGDPAPRSIHGFKDLATGAGFGLGVGHVFPAALLRSFVAATGRANI